MSTIKQHSATRRGPVALQVSTDSPDIEVTIDPECEIASVQVITPDDEGPAADAVNAARIAEGNGALAVSVVGPQGVIISNHGGGTVIVGDNHGSVQNVVFGGGRVIANGPGSVVIGGSVRGVISTGRNVVINSGGAVAGMSQVTIVAKLPAGSTVDTTAMSGNTTVEGPAKSVHARSSSGDVEITGDIETAYARASSGDITIEGAENVTAQASSGDIEITGGRTIDASTSSGDIKADDMAGEARLSASSGDVKLSATPDATMATVSTASGDITTSGCKREGFRLTTQSVAGRVRNR